MCGYSWPIARLILESCDRRSYDQSWHRTINRCIHSKKNRHQFHFSGRDWYTRHSNMLSSGVVVIWTSETYPHLLASGSRILVVPPVVSSCNQSGHVVSSRTTERDFVRRVAPPIARWHDQCTTNRATAWPTIIHNCGGATTHDCWDDLRPITIWNRRWEVLNITIDLALTGFTLAIIRDLCDQPCVRFTFCSRFQKNQSQLGRNLVAGSAWAMYFRPIHTKIAI